MTQQHLASGKAQQDRVEQPDSQHSERQPPAGRDLGGLVSAVFEAWRGAGIEFLILRNYEGLPTAASNDIDVLVRPDHLASAEAALISAARQTGYVLHNRVEFGPISLFFHHPESWQQIQFDLFHCLNWRGLALLSPQIVLARKVERGMFPIPHPAHEAVLNLVTRILYHGQAREKYRPGILAAVKQDPDEVSAIFAEMFDGGTARELTRAVLVERWEHVERQTSTLRRQLIWRRLSRQPLQTLVTLLRDMRRFVGRWWRSPGMLVVLLGADGCGKSSVARQLTESLRHTFNPGKGLHGHWKPMVLPLRRRTERKPTTDPHGQPPRGRLASLLVLFCHWLEYLVGGCIQFTPILFRNGLVLMDRYHYDFAVDPWRYRLQVPKGTVRALFSLLPAPDLVIVLDAPTEALRARKQEVSEEETRRQQEAFREIAAQLPNGRLVDCSRPLDAVVQDVAGHVLHFLAVRQTKRSRP